VRFYLPVRSSYLLIPAAVAVLVFSAGRAEAGAGFGQLIVNPGTATAGETVSLLGVCPTNGHPLSGVFSTAFVGGQATISLGSENFTGTAAVASVAPGTYKVTAKCGPGSPSMNITVMASGASAPVTTQPPPPKPRPKPSPTLTWTTQAPAMPVQTEAPRTQAPTAGMQSMTNTAAAAAVHTTAISPTPMPSVAGEAAAPAASAGLVTSAAVVPVGLAGSSRPIMTPTSVGAAIALIFVAAAAIGFLVYRSKRKSGTTHS
jgi:hypothetical protein